LPDNSGIVTIPFQVDHIVPVKHGRLDDVDNLCLACYKCNGYKGADIAGFDPETGEISRLYHPRQQQWHEHFELSQTQVLIGLTGLTSEGRATIVVLQINQEPRIQQRQVLAEIGRYPYT
jgi:hypothetical protein